MRNAAIFDIFEITSVAVWKKGYSCTREEKRTMGSLEKSTELLREAS